MDNDNKQIKIVAGSSENRVGGEILSPDLFKDNPELLYLKQKTERLVSALYLLAGVLSDSEPVKSELKVSGLVLLNSVFEMSDKKKIQLDLSKILSLIEVSFVGGIISTMNHNIFRTEVEAILTYLSELIQKDTKQIVFPDHFLTLDKPDLNLEKTTANALVMSDRLSLKKSEPKVKDRPNRQEIILSLLRKKGTLSIKDFVSEISDCSEKTIQRELVSLVSKGLVKKDGEKRWSRYSIKSV